MAMLNYNEEIRTPAEVLPRPKRPPGAVKQVKLAQTLINAWYSDDFDFTSYDDNYRERLERLIQSKKKGHEVVEPEEQQEEPEVINLMEALKQSVQQAKPSRSKKKPRKRKRSA
jgi:DNA end-binding protein Ku